MGVRPVCGGWLYGGAEGVCNQGRSFFSHTFLSFFSFPVSGERCQRTAGIGGGRTATGPGAKFSPGAAKKRHRSDGRATNGAENIVQQVLAAWRTATAGRPKGEDLYSPRKDLGADLH